MEPVVHRVRLDVLKSGSQKSICVKQNDTKTRKVNVQLFAGPEPYFLSEGITAVFRAIKPDGTELYNGCEVVGNAIEIILTTQTLSAPGTVKAEIELLGSDGERLMSPGFDIYVEEVITSDEWVESRDEYTALSELLTRAVGAESERTEAEAERADVEQERQNAELERRTCEQKRAEAETERKAAEEERRELYTKWLNPSAEAVAGDSPAANVQFGSDGVHFLFTNARGPQGETGAAGPRGETGAPGPQGPQGIQGPKGDKGDTGATGPQGPRGVQGPKGDKGDPGTGLDIIGTYGSIAALQAAILNPSQGDMYNVGTAAPYTIYMWDSGAWVSQGQLQGVKGESGDNGTTFTPFVSDSGVLSWTNDGGLPNPDSVNIKGQKGDTGDVGPQGAQGPQGPEGPKGDKGDTGEAGPQGPKGDKGDTGEVGPQGPEGPKGDKGDTGEGIAAGGTDGQVLVKVGGGDYDTAWSSSFAQKEYVNENFLPLSERDKLYGAHNKPTATDVGALPLYTSLESIGCSTASTLEDIFFALPLHSQLVIGWCGSSPAGYAGTTFGNSLPGGYGTLIVRKNDMCEFEFRQYVNATAYPIVHLKYADYANDTYHEKAWVRNITSHVESPNFASTSGLSTVYEGTIKVTGNIVSLLLRGTFKTAGAEAVVATLPSTVPLPSVRPHVPILNHGNATAIGGIAWISGRNIQVSGISTAGHYSITMTYVGE